MRPALLDPLFASLDNLTGIGDKTRKKLSLLLGGNNPERKPVIADLLFHQPTGLIHRGKSTSIAQMVPGEIATIKVTIGEHLTPAPAAPRRIPYRINATDHSGHLQIVFYHTRAAWIRQNLPEGATRVISGKIEVFRDQLQIVHPEYMLSEEDAHEIPEIEAVYPLTSGLTSKVLTQAIKQASKRLPELNEWQDPHWLAQQKWCSFREALLRIHAPTSQDDFETNDQSRQRLAYDELLAHQIVMALVRETNTKDAGRRLTPNIDLESLILAKLPFHLTPGQELAISEIYADMATPHLMHRLLQGDVGSGKTVVGLLAAIRAIAAGTQAALMVPTEVLARQHLESLNPLLESAGLRCELLTGRNKGKARKALLDALASGEIHLLIGTHALFQKDVEYADLGLVIIDEQHRFGVQQRMTLQAKGKADVLVMTATPIPRTLLMTHYGDMEVSRIEDKPSGRQPVKTSLINNSRIEEILQGLERVFVRGEQAYWICPLVEESEKMDLAAATERYEHLNKKWPGKIGLIHGRLTTEEKGAIMQAFQSGELDILVATTVIEVGVHVANATTIIIEHAERFGLSQLHQLRGRVGRGTQASNAILLYQPPLSATAKARLQKIRETEDGFLIAEEDLRLRGGGEILGTRQSGLADYRLARFPAHSDLLKAARDDAQLVMNLDPELSTQRGQAIRVLLYLFRLDEAIRYIKTG